MKTYLYTFLIRWYSVQAKPLPQWLERACEQDPQLGSERTAEASLTTALSAAPKASQSAPDAAALSAKILAALEKDAGTEAFPPSRSEPVAIGPLLRVVALPLAAAAAVAIFLTLEVSPPVGDLPNEGRVAVVEVAPASEGVMDHESERALWKNPLDQEVENVLADAKGAVGFLASTFLPSRVAEDLLRGDQKAS